MNLNFTTLRSEMIQEQLIPREIKDSRVLQVFARVPRHLFVPKKYQNSAYDDSPLPIGAGQTISQPYMVALMTQSLDLSGREVVLEVGTGSGYQTAILAQLASAVFSLERNPDLAQKAQIRLNNLGHNNIQIKVGDGTLGWPQHAPYDAIVVSAAAPKIPQPLIEQLNKLGRLIIPIGGGFHQALTLIKKNKTGTESKEICGCVFVPLIGKYGWKAQDA